MATMALSSARDHVVTADPVLVKPFLYGQAELSQDTDDAVSMTIPYAFTQGSPAEEHATRSGMDRLLSDLSAAQILFREPVDVPAPTRTASGEIMVITRTIPLVGNTLRQAYPIFKRHFAKAISLEH